MTSIGDVEVRAIIKFCVGIEKTPTETYKTIQASSTTKKCCRSLVFRWHEMFRNGRESIEDDKRCGRPSVVKSGVKDKVRQLLNEDRRRTVREMSSELGVSVFTVHDCLKEDNMSKVSARWVPRLLKNDERECRLRCSHEFFQRVEREGVAFLDRTITTDETWLFHFDPESKQESSIWKTPGSPPPKNVRVHKSGGKHMFVFFMDRRGMLIPPLNPGRTDSYRGLLLKGSTARSRLGYKEEAPRDGPRPSNTTLGQRPRSPCSVYSVTNQPPGIRDAGTSALQPPSMDFRVFPEIKAQLRGKRFDSGMDLQIETQRIVSTFNTAWYEDTYDKWVNRQRKCIAVNGDYVEK